MIRLRIVGLALVVVFAMSAMVASAASAALPEFSTSSTFKASSGHALLETKAGHKVECSASTGEGTITAPKSVTKASVKFTGCKEPEIGATCSSGSKSGEIVTKMLAGTLKYINAGAKEVGIELKPESSTEKVFVTFKCEIFGFGSTLTVRGSLTGKITPVNTKTNTYTLAYTQSKGKQTYPSESLLETESSGIVSFPYEESGQEVSATVITSTVGEIKA